jgi:hypothetical protein
MILFRLGHSILLEGQLKVVGALMTPERCRTKISLTQAVGTEVEKALTMQVIQDYTQEQDPMKQR